MDNELTVKDIDILMEALAAWETKDLLGVSLGGIFTKLTKAPNAEKIIEDNMQKYEMKVKKNKEISILLQAKLIKLKDTIQINSLTKGE